jgi:putative membrane protein
MLAAILSALHLLALAIGLPAIWSRAQALRGPLDPAGVRRVLLADHAWGMAAFLWLATGPWRAFGPIEKGTAFYLSSPLFHLKIGLFLLVVLLEIWPMIRLIRWRMQLKRGQPVDLGAAPAMRTLSLVQTVLVIAIVFVASFMARGFGMAR